MANVKKGTLIAPKQWWKHLRDWKRIQNKAERSAVKKQINGEIKMDDMFICDDCGNEFDIKEMVKDTHIRTGVVKQFCKYCAELNMMEE